MSAARQVVCAFMVLAKQALGVGIYSLEPVHQVNDVNTVGGVATLLPPAGATDCFSHAPFVLNVDP